MLAFVGLDHADQAVPVAQRVVDHRQIARLENIERHLPARQQQRARQRKHRDDVRQVDRPAISGVHRHRFTPQLPFAAAHHENRSDDKPLAAVKRRLVGGAPRLEELHQLLARRVVVPFAVALDDFEQMIAASARLPAALSAAARSNRA